MITAAEQFGIAAQVTGRVEAGAEKELVIVLPEEILIYNSK